MVVVVAHVRHELVVFRVPNTEQILVSEVLLKCTQYELGDAIIPATSDCTQQCGMHDELSFIKHLPPVRETVIGDAAIQFVRHESVRQFRSRPVILEITLFSVIPLGSSCTVAGNQGFIVYRREEATAIRFIRFITCRTVTLDRIHCARACLL